MKKSLLFAVALSLLVSAAFALAQGGTASATPGHSATGKSQPSMAQMDDHMKKMQALHEKMTGATTPEERQKAMDEARKEMQASMSTMQPMMMHGGGMMGGGMMNQKGASNDAATQMQMMNKRMDMMQMMMQMMMDQQGMMTAPPKGADTTPKK